MLWLGAVLAVSVRIRRARTGEAKTNSWSRFVSSRAAVVVVVVVVENTAHTCAGWLVRARVWWFGAVAGRDG